jgi:hypothetical protein
VKDGKLYSVKPTDGSGDLTFSRGSDIEATRVAANGYIEKAKVNLLLQSNSFDTTWTNTDTTETGGQAGYDGTSDAWLLSKSAAAAYIEEGALSGSGIYTLSVYAKAGTLNWMRFVMAHSGTNPACFYDLANGVVGTEKENVDATITSVGGGWYRCSLTGNLSSLSAVRIYPADADEDTTGTSGNIYIQDAQLNYGLVAQTYQETTTAAVVSGITDNMPRLNYDPANPTCPSLLLEPSRTNYFTQSEYLASYPINRVSISSNVTTSPEGVVNASELVPTTDNGDHTLQALIDFGNVTNTFSIFAKRNGVDISLSFAGSSSSWTGCIFDLANGIAKTPQNAGSQSICTASIEPYGDDWYKCSITATPYASGTFYVFVSLANNVDGSLSTWGRQSFVGVPSQTAYLYGGDLQRASYPTSYIPTYGSSATRTSDACSKTGIASLIGQSEGTVFLEVDYSTLSGLDMFLSIRPNASNKVEVYRDGGTIYGDLTASSSFAFSASKAVGTHKIAFAYKSGSSALYIDGILIDQNTTSFTFSASLANLYINQRSGGLYTEAANYKQALLFTSRLSNADLATLTSL